MQPLDAADRFFGIEIHHGGNRPIMPKARTTVQMPPFETFRDAESHAATLARHDGMIPAAALCD
jgi:antirestriction protein ArdC